MLTRRSFIIGAAGLLTYSILDKYINYFERTGEALIEEPVDYDKVLRLDDGDWLALGDFEDYEIEEYPPAPTWRVFIEDYYNEIVDPNNPDFVGYIFEKWGIRAEEFDKPYNRGNWEACYEEEFRCRKNTPNAEAYHYLKSLDLGTDLQGDGNNSYGLYFGDFMGVHRDTCSVEPWNEVSMSLLQLKLTELGEKTAVFMC